MWLGKQNTINLKDRGSVPIYSKYSLNWSYYEYSQPHFPHLILNPLLPSNRTRSLSPVMPGLHPLHAVHSAGRPFLFFSTSWLPEYVTKLELQENPSLLVGKGHSLGLLLVSMLPVGWRSWSKASTWPPPGKQLDCCQNKHMISYCNRVSTTWKCLFCALSLSHWHCVGQNSCPPSAHLPTHSLNRWHFSHLAKVKAISLLQGLPAYRFTYTRFQTDTAFPPDRGQFSCECSGFLSSVS